MCPKIQVHNNRTFEGQRAVGNSFIVINRPVCSVGVVGLVWFRVRWVRGLRFARGRELSFFV